MHVEVSANSGIAMGRLVVGSTLGTRHKKELRGCQHLSCPACTPTCTDDGMLEYSQMAEQEEEEISMESGN